MPPPQLVSTGGSKQFQKRAVLAWVLPVVLTVCGVLPDLLLGENTSVFLDIQTPTLAHRLPL